MELRVVLGFQKRKKVELRHAEKEYGNVRWRLAARSAEALIADATVAGLGFVADQRGRAATRLGKWWRAMRLP